MGNGLGDTKLDGWNDPAEPEGTFPPKVIPVGDLYDYRTWATETRGWRKLMASVNGGAAVFSEEGLKYAAGRVNVGSVVEAARAFQATQDLLIWLEQTIRTAVASMVGDDKAWKGPAANGFRDKMNFYADLLGKQAEHLAGGAVPDSTTAANSINSSTNVTSLPSQLYDAANHLSWAQQTISYLDGAWATIASQNGVGSGSGPVPISGTEYEKPMAQQMADVVHTVAEQYKMTTDKAGTSGITMPTPSITTPTMPNFTTPNLTTPNLTPPPTLTPPGFTPPPVGGITTPGFTTPPNITVPTITPPNLAGIGGPGSGQGPGGVTPPSFSDPGEIGGPTPGGGSGLPGFDAPGINGPGGVGFPGVGVPGGGGLPGGLGSGVVPPGVKPPGSANLGGGVGGAGSVKPPSFSGPGEVGSPKPGAGTGTGTGIGRPGGGFTAPSIPGFGPPGGAGPGAGGSPGLPEKPDANGLLGNSDDFAPGTVGGVDIPAAPGGAVPGGGGFQSPMMPGMPGAGAPGAGAGGGSGVPEAPDAKGLVEGDEADWRSPGFDGVQVPGAPAGASSGGAGLGAPMPAVPGMPGPAGGANNPAGAESPDARGLVSGDPETWGPVGVDAGVPDGSAGAPAGGDGLGVDGPQIPAGPPVAPGVGVDSPVAAAPPGAAMPMMPGAPGAPGAGAGTPGGGVPDAPDASGLIEADIDDWRPSTPDAAGPQAPAGAGAGGTGLVEPPPSAPLIAGATPPIAGVVPPVAGPPGGNAPAGTTPRTAPDVSGLIRPDETDWTPAGPGDFAPEAGDGTTAGGAGLDGSAPVADVSGPQPGPGGGTADLDGSVPVTGVPGAQAGPDGPPAGPDPGVPEAAVEEPAAPDVPAAPVSGTGGTSPGAPVPEVIAPPTAVEVPTVVDLSPAVGGVVAAPVIVGQPGQPSLPAQPGPVPNPPAQTATPNPSGQPNPPAQSNPSVSPGGGSPEGTHRKAGVAAAVADGEVAVAVPGALGLAGAAAVAGLAGPGPQPSGRATPGADPDEPARAGTVRGRSDRDDDREPGADREPAAGLREDDAVWGGDRARPAADDHVPLVRPDDDPDDTTDWDDLSDADWLTGTSADDGREG
ncbi:hypothetical protein ABZ328_05320 [Micromonospora aurantiaca]|uniref:hypothetical protein n=1 Tax=Micromonospora aurantiaca (nom. illeg.) TaxID=47850 RepID=UPI00340DB140